MTASIHAERVTYVASLTDAEPVTQVTPHGTHDQPGGW